VAFNAMAAENETTNPERKLTYLQVANESTFAIAAELSAQVIENNMPNWVDAALSGEGIDVNNKQSQDMLNDICSEATANTIIALGDVLTPKYPGLKIGHLDNARQMRVEGRV